MDKFGLVIGKMGQLFYSQKKILKFLKLHSPKSTRSELYNKKNMKILILTVGSNYHSPVLLRKLFAYFNNHSFFVLISKKKSKKPIRSIIRRYGVYYTFLKVIERIIYKWRSFKEKLFIKDFLDRDYISLHDVLNKYDIANDYVVNINSKKSFDKILRFSPDLIISIYFDQILKKDILNITYFPPINLHPSLLPRYLGSSPTFWVMVKGEKRTGITIHEMYEKVDDGRILYQEETPIYKEDTQFSLYRRCSNTFEKPLINYIDCLCNNKTFTTNVITDPSEQRSYYSKVTTKDLSIFLKRGFKFI